MNEPTLKPCPFAGCAGTSELELWGDNEYSPFSWVSCNNCGSQGPEVLGGHAEAVKAWNNRTPREESEEG